MHERQMVAYSIARALLFTMALACLWMSRVAWLQARDEALAMRAVGPLFWCLAAATIGYGVVNP